MHVLIVKTSSLGDIIHTFPALSDAAVAIPGIRFDWVVEEGYEQIPTWHPAVDRVVSTAMRRWRQSWLKTWLRGDWKTFVEQLQRRRYDAVIDAQGLIKSALITRKALGAKHGLDQRSARESQASLFYDQAYGIDKDQHAIERTRQLFAQALGYDHQGLPLQYGLQVQADPSIDAPFITLLHGTAWPSKRWPDDFWQALIRLIGEAGLQVRIPAGTQEEQSLSQQLINGMDHAQLLPVMGLSELAPVLKASSGVIAVDTGLAHMAAALDVPVISLYGATSTRRTGVMGKATKALQATEDCSPCYERECPRLSERHIVPPCTRSWSAENIWAELEQLMGSA